MPAPIDYRTQVASPFESAVQGLQFGSGIAEMQRATDKREQEAALQVQQQAAMKKLASESATYDDYVSASVLFPGMKESIQQAWDIKSGVEQKQALTDMGEVYAALSSKNPQIAVDIFNSRADALENSGGSQQEVKAYRDMARLAEINPGFLRMKTGMALGAVPGGDKVIEGYAKLSETRTKEGLRDSEIKQAALDLDKTEAETKKLLQEVDKLDRESQKAVLELEAMQKGEKIIDPTKAFDQEEKLRKEYVARTKGFTESQRVHDNIKASATAGAPGDIALVTSFMKMLDPGSVVRETEFATARDTAGLLTRLGNLATKIESGEFLSDDQRKSFVALAGKYMEAAEKQEKGIRKDLDFVVKNYKLNADNVFGTKAEEVTETRNIVVDY